VYLVYEINSKIFFLADVLFLGRQPALESSWIHLNKVHFLTIATCFRLMQQC